MLWRPGYRSLVAYELQLPDSPAFDQPQILIGGFEFAALREMSIWRRLAERDASHVPWSLTFFLNRIGPQDEELLDSLVPGSLRDRTSAIIDQGSNWRNLVQPSHQDQSFAAVIETQTAKVMMKGLPTEEGWDAFLSQLD